MINYLIRELDEIALTVDLPELKLVRDQVGMVVFVYAPDALEVEFVDDNGRTYGAHYTEWIAIASSPLQTHRGIGRQQKPGIRTSHVAFSNYLGM